MAKYFLGSVGEATAFRINANGSKTFMFNATSLTDQGINISSSQDEIRGGTGAIVQATFNHDTSVQLTLTDIFWKSEYVEAKLGQKFAATKNGNNITDYYSQEVVMASASNSITLDHAPIPALLPCSSQEDYLIWYAPQGTDDWKELVVSGVAGNVVTAVDSIAAGTYCFRYLTRDEQAREIWVGADMVPDELYLIIKTPVYAGDACAASNGNIAGHITFEIPRFKIDANLDLSFAMSSNTTLSIGGSALAYTNDCNANGSKLMRIVENLSGRKWYDGLTAIYIDPAFEAKAGQVVPVYGVYKNGSVSLLDNTATYGDPAAAALTFAIAGGTLTVTLAAGVTGKADTDSMSTTATSVSAAGVLS